MKSLVMGITAAALMAGVAAAQTAAPQTGQAGSGGTTNSVAPTPGGTSAGVSGQRNTTSDDVKAASGNSNQAVATTGASAATPAKGANSFTEGEAKSRLSDRGFADVGGLKKDDDGIWHGTAKRNGTATNVWLDYKGNTGEVK